MPAKAFLDTNVLVYAFAADDARRSVAKDLLAAGGAFSVQVLNEFANVSRRKLKLDWDEIGERIEVLDALLDEPVPITRATHRSARLLARDHRLGFYDALIVASALETGADVLLSEDLQHRRKFGRLLVVNPFARGSPET